MERRRPRLMIPTTAPRRPLPLMPMIHVLRHFPPRRRHRPSKVRTAFITAALLTRLPREPPRSHNRRSLRNLIPRHTHRRHRELTRPHPRRFKHRHHNMSPPNIRRRSHRYRNTLHCRSLPSNTIRLTRCRLPIRHRLRSPVRIPTPIPTVASATVRCAIRVIPRPTSVSIR